MVRLPRGVCHGDVAQGALPVLARCGVRTFECAAGCDDIVNEQNALRGWGAGRFFGIPDEGVLPGADALGPPKFGQ